MVYRLGWGSQFECNAYHPLGWVPVSIATDELNRVFGISVSYIGKVYITGWSVGGYCGAMVLWSE